MFDMCFVMVYYESMIKINKENRMTRKQEIHKMRISISKSVRKSQAAGVNDPVNMAYEILDSLLAEYKITKYNSLRGTE